MISALLKNVRSSLYHYRLLPQQQFSFSTSLKRTMDVVISQPAPDQIKVLPHLQYRTVDNISPLNVAPSPLDQFRIWFKQAVEGGVVNEPEAMNLSTATPNGIPSARIVLLKQVDSTGFVFFTNYTSRKSKELEANPHAALAFYWREVHRSVRVVGRVEKLSRAESEEYFQSRPLGSQLGAWASKQSTIIGEDYLNNRLESVKEKFQVTDEANGHVPTPEFWGGWRVIPEEVEFWSGKPSRLHDRVQYIRKGDGWDINRLSP